MLSLDNNNAQRELVLPEMPLVRVYRELEEKHTVGTAGLLLQRLRNACPTLTRLQQETCYYILVNEK